jgi:formate dehydrogenase
MSDQVTDFAMTSPGSDGEHITYCRLCNSLCGMVATVQDGVITAMKPDRDNPSSRGHICVKGPAIAAITQDPDRILYPLKRVGGPGEFKRVGWDEALDDIASRLRAIVDEDGPQAFGCYIGNPSGYSWNFAYANQFAKKIGSDKYYSSIALDIGSRMAASELVWGNPWTFMFPDLPANDLLLVLGSNLLVSQGTALGDPLIREDLNNIAKRGRVIVVDPRRTETARTYEHVPIRPDSDVWLLCAMLGIMDREGWLDQSLIDDHTAGAGTLLDAVGKIELHECSLRTGIPLETILEITHAFATTKNAAAYSRLGLCRGSYPTLSNILVDMLNILGGKIGSGGGAVFGYSPNPHEAKLGGGAAETIGKIRTRVGNLPGVSGSLPSSAMAADILEPGLGRLRALMVVAGNPVLSSPGGDEMEHALDACDLFFSIDIYKTETNRFADYILPSTTFIERDDLQMHFIAHMVRPHIQYTHAVIEPLGEARPEVDIMNDISKRGGFGSLFGSDPASNKEFKIRDLVDDILRKSDIGDGYGTRPNGVSLDRLAKDFPHGMPIKGRYPRKDWTARISAAGKRVRCWGDVIATEFERLRATSAIGKDELLLFGQRDIRHMNSWMHNPERLVRNATPVLLLHPDDAAPRGLVDKAMARLSSASGAIDVCVHVTTDVIPGSVCYPHGWGHKGGWRRANAAGGANINLLASTRPEDQEWISGMARLEGMSVFLAPL